jgi:MFS family permease
MGNIEQEQRKQEELKSEARRISIFEGSAFSVSDGFGLRNITSYAVALNSSNYLIGLLSSIPSLIGNLSQIFSTRLLEKYPRKKIVMISVFLQALMWLAILIPGVLFLLSYEKISGSLLVWIYTILITVGAIGGPAWSSWMKDILNEKSGGYLAKRNKIIGIVALLSMIIGGFVLDYFKKTNVFIGFFILFFVSFIARSVSALTFLKQYEPPLKLHGNKEYYFSFWSFLKKVNTNNFGKFVIFVSGITFATAIASPFMSVYMLKELNLSYSLFFFVNLSSVLSALIFMSSWGRIIDRFGDVKTLRVSGFFIFIVPLFWLMAHFVSASHVVAYLFLIELFSGIIWSGFNLAAGNFIYKVVSRERVALCSSYFNVINGFGAFLGAILGGILASSNFKIFGSALLLVFLISAIVRAIFYFSLFSTFKETREFEEFSLHKFTKEIFFLNPAKLFNYFNLREYKPRGVS